jgi:2-methylisocitrate lyase-like PEP mutase family enzyme
MELNPTEKRKALRAMMQEAVCHIAPSCNDGIQARLVEWLGFPLVHISGSGQHRALGFADAGLLTLTEMVNKAREIVDAVDIPIVSDGETGYGNAVNVTRAVREFEKAGVAALHIEDQMTPKRAGHEGFDVGLVSREEFVNKIKAAVDTRQDANLVIIARSEAKDSLQERIERVAACCEAGADAVWLSARTEDESKPSGKSASQWLACRPVSSCPCRAGASSAAGSAASRPCFRSPHCTACASALKNCKRAAPKPLISSRLPASKTRASGTRIWATRN